MDTHESNPNPAGALPLSIAAAVVALVVACLFWSMLGYLVAWKMQLSLGVILPPLAAGCLGGLVMRCSRSGFGPKTGWIAAVVVLIGCVIGDVVWIMLAQQKSLGVLFGAELTATINTLTNLLKLIMFAVASYLAFVIANPPRGVVAD